MKRLSGLRILLFALILPVAFVTTASTCGDDDDDETADDDTGDDDAADDDTTDDNDDDDNPLDCGDECEEQTYSICTCDPTDPCGWLEDEFCDWGMCEYLYGFSFDDREQACSGYPCFTLCERVILSECTCDQADPCGWIGDGACEYYDCIDEIGFSFDDRDLDC